MISSKSDMILSETGSIAIRVEPSQLPVSWDQFTWTYPAFSIALDGYVRGAPRFDPTGPRANFNHHEDVDRLSTRSTCAQVLMAQRMGLTECFRDNGGVRMDAFVHDCDEDVCVSAALLLRPDMCQPSNSVYNRLVALEDLLDTTAGMYPLHKDSPALAELAWVFEPYRQFRMSGQIDKRDAAAFKSVITDVVARIQTHLVGRGRSVPVDTRYERIGGGTGWTAVREIGNQARIGMCSDGIRVFVSVRAHGAGVYTYTIGRASAFVKPDLRAVCMSLLALEPGWGGGDTIMGSPRVSGSRLSPEQVYAVVERHCVAKE